MKYRPDLDSEMDELQRVVQDLSRDENINISVEQLVKVFKNSKEETLTNDIWGKLENTESNEIQKGDTNAVMNIAKMYNKTSPKVLAKAIIKGKYNRPLILKLGDRYILIAGNTRLCTAAAIGVSPKVFIATIENMNENKKIDSQLDGNQQDMVYGIINIVKKVKDIENRKKIANDMVKQFKEEKIKFDYNIFMELCGLSKKKETTEQTTSGSSGSFEGPAFGSMVKRKITSIPNANLNEHEEELEEVTDSSSSGAYDVPAFGKTTKGGRRDPLKIDGPDSIYKGRAVTDKKFPKWGGPGGVFVKIKEKCKKFPYCNQGNTGALEFIKEDKEIQDAINEVSKNTGIPKNEIQKIVLNEIKQIFI
jgi:hypothetical protein